MDYLDFGDTIDYNKFNALVYLLRKFKKLTSELELGAYDINTDYGDFHFTDGFVNVGNNWILEKNVMVITRNCLPNCIYSFVFTVIDVNTSGTVNKRLVRLESLPSGDERSFNLKIPKNLINDDEVILPDFTMEVVFDEHEYYTPLPDIHLSLSVDKRIIKAGEVATVTGLLVDGAGEPIENILVPLNVNGSIVTVLTDSTGEFTYSYTGTGSVGHVIVGAYGVNIRFYDGTSEYITAVVTGNSIRVGYHNGAVLSSGSVVIDWGDGNTDTVDNTTTLLSHTYSDGESEHLIIFDGDVIQLRDSCFMNQNTLKSIVIPDGVNSLGYACFGLCKGLSSVSIPASVNSIGNFCFTDCTSLILYDLYWTSNPIIYNRDKMPVNKDTVFNIPYGTTSIYTDAGYPSARLVEREPTEPLDTVLSISSDKQSIFTDETIIITGTLLDEDNNPVKQANVKLYDGNTLLDTLTTDNNGAYTKTITGLSSGSHTVHASFEGTSNYNASTSSNITITVSEPTYNLVLSSDTPIIQKESTATINALLTHNGSAYSSQSLSYTVKHGSTVLDSGSVTTDLNGEASITYTGTGIGDVSVEVSYGTLLQKTFVVEDCNYWNTAEVTRTSTNGSTIYDNNMSEALPSNCEISFDIWSDNSNTGGEHRFFLLPKSQYSSGTVQPQYGLYIDQVGGNRGNLGQRNNNKTNEFIQLNPFNNSSYHTVKIIKNNNSLEFYVDDTLKTTQVLDWINNYTDYCFSMMRWSSSGTSKIKNVKIKAL